MRSRIKGNFIHNSLQIRTFNGLMKRITYFIMMSIDDNGSIDMNL